MELLYGCIVGMIAAGMLLCLVLLALLAWRFIKKYGFKAKKYRNVKQNLTHVKQNLVDNIRFSWYSGRKEENVGRPFFFQNKK